MRERALGVDTEQAVARGHFDDEEISRTVEIYAEGLFQLGLQSGQADAVGVAAGDEDDFFGVQGGSERKSGEQEQGRGEFHRRRNGAT